LSSLPLQPITGNVFGCKNFCKYPNKFFPLEIDYGDDKSQELMLANAGAKSNLHVAVQALIKSIFDISAMKKVLKDFEIDLNKMPLGKLSRQHIKSVYIILQKAAKLVSSGMLVGSHMLDCTNQFYTLIPHSYGFDQPPLLNNKEIIDSKTKMVENLMEIEYAYNILKSEKDVKVEDDEDILDVNYKKLRCDINTLTRESEEFKMIEKYALLTHASTHTEYKLKIEEVFKINREGKTFYVELM